MRRLCWVLAVVLVVLGGGEEGVHGRHQSLISVLEHFNATYDFSHNAQFMLLWWTANEGDNTLKIAAVANETGWCGVGFQIKSLYVQMNGVALVGINGVGVQFYDLTGAASAFQDNSPAILDSQISVIDNLMVMEAVWNLSVPNKMKIDYSVKDEFVVMFASFSTPENPIQTFHDYVSTQNISLLTGANAIPITICDCENGIPRAMYQCPCSSCFGSFMLPTCQTNKLTNHYSFTSSGTEIADMYWQTLQDNLVHFDVVASNYQWASIAFSNPHGQMPGSYAVIVQANCSSSFSKGKAGYPEGVLSVYMTERSPQGFNSHTFNISEVSCWTSGNIIGVHFARMIDDSIDSLGDGTGVPMIAAASTSPYPKKHTVKTQGPVMVNLISGEVISRFVWTNETTHGLLMVISWDFVIPFGYTWARFVRKAYTNDQWWQGHRTAMTLGFAISLSGFILAFIMVGNDHLSTAWHAQVGLFVLAAMIFQVCSGIMRPHPPEKGKPKAPERLFFEISHHLFGRFGIIASWAVVFEGLRIYGAPPILIILHFIIVGIWCLMSLICEIKFSILFDRREYEELTKGVNNG